MDGRGGHERQVETRSCLEGEDALIDLSGSGRDHEFMMTTLVLLLLLLLLRAESST